MNEALRQKLSETFGDRFVESGAERVVFPSTERELVDLVELARRNDLALSKDLIVGRKLLDAIGPIDSRSAVVTVGAGATVRAIDRAAELAGLSMGPLSPWALQLDTGSLIESAYAGLRAVPSGRLEPIHLALDAVMPDGRVFRSLPSPRSAAGPDLDALFAGSDRSLGIVFAATVRLVPRPVVERVLSYRFPRPARALTALRHMLLDGCTLSWAAVSPGTAQADLDVVLGGSHRSVDRDGESVARRARELEARPVARSTIRLAEAPLPEVEVTWREVERAVEAKRPLRLFRLSLDTVIVDAPLEGLPLSGKPPPNPAWKQLADFLDPEHVMGGAS